MEQETPSQLGAPLAPNEAKLRGWRRKRSESLPTRAGCFKTSNFDDAWERMPCSTAPEPEPSGLPRDRFGKEVVESVGNGTDYVATVSGRIVAADGTFPSMTNVTSTMPLPSGVGRARSPLGPRPFMPVGCHDVRRLTAHCAKRSLDRPPADACPSTFSRGTREHIGDGAGRRFLRSLWWSLKRLPCVEPDAD